MYMVNFNTNINYGYQEYLKGEFDHHDIKLPILASEFTFDRPASLNLQLSIISQYKAILYKENMI